MGATNTTSEIDVADGKVGVADEEFDVADEEFDRFRRPATEVRACQLDMRAAIDTADGLVIAEPGEWVVKNADGTRHICSDETFRETYRGATIAANKVLDPQE